MKNLVYALLGLAVIVMILGVLARFSAPANMIMGIGQRGYMGIGALLLLLSSNLALIELLNKK